MEIKDYLRIARRRWLLIAACFLACVAVTAVVTFRAVPQYSSTTKLFISTPSSNASEVFAGGTFSQQRVASYADLVQDRDVAERVLKGSRIDLTADELAGRVTATVVPETVNLQISVTDPDPDVARDLAEGYADAMTQVVREFETPEGGGIAPIKATQAGNASLPTAPVSPQPLRNLGLAAVLGLLLGFGAAVLRELLDTTLKSPEDVSEAADTAVMGNIAWDSQAAKTPLITDISTHAPRAEAFRVLRTNLQFVDVDSTSKIFTISSALPQDGKTSTATNLALALAQGGQRTLLIDGDLRRPKIDSKLGLEHAVGLTTVLVGKVTAEDAVQTHAGSKLDVMTSGSIPPNPAELLQSHAMTELLAKLKASYDIVIIDAPPLLPVTDAALLAAQSDGALIVVRHGRTTKDQLVSSVERLEAVDARPLGVVMNMVPNRRKGKYGYGYGYGYGYAPEANTLKNRRNKPEPGTA